jgi:hypothetical protein
MAKVRRSHRLNANPVPAVSQVIVSMSWLPTLRAQRLLRDVFVDVRGTAKARHFAFDVLVVVETHHVVPASPTTAPGRRSYRPRPSSCLSGKIGCMRGVLPTHKIF